MMTKSHTITDEYGHELTVPGPFYTIAMARRANEAHGHFFFSPDTMRFFRSRVAPGTIAGRLIVTSEQFVPYDGAPDARRYTVRAIHDDGSFWAVGEFQQFDSLAQARTFARKLVQS